MPVNFLPSGVEYLRFLPEIVLSVVRDRHHVAGSCYAAGR